MGSRPRKRMNRVQRLMTPHCLYKVIVSFVWIPVRSSLSRGDILLIAVSESPLSTASTNWNAPQMAGRVRGSGVTVFRLQVPQRLHLSKDAIGERERERVTVLRHHTGRRIMFLISSAYCSVVRIILPSFSALL